MFLLLYVAFFLYSFFFFHLKLLDFLHNIHSRFLFIYIKRNFSKSKKRIKSYFFFFFKDFQIFEMYTVTIQENNNSNIDWKVTLYEPRNKLERTLRKKKYVSVGKNRFNDCLIILLWLWDKISVYMMSLPFLYEIQQSLLWPLFHCKSLFEHIFFV